MKIEEEIEDIISKDIRNLGYILWGIELSGKNNSKLIRVYIDNEDAPINLRDCEIVSAQIKEVLENTDLYQLQLCLGSFFTWNRKNLF